MRDIPWNEAWALGISRGLSLYFTIYPNTSHSTDSLNYNYRIVLPGRAILKELVIYIALSAGAIFSSTLPVDISVFKIICKSHYQGQKRTQHLCCAILWQNVPWFFQYFWISKNVYKKRLKCNLLNVFCILDERARNARKCEFFLGFLMKSWSWKPNFIVVYKFM